MFHAHTDDDDNFTALSQSLGHTPPLIDLGLASDGFATPNPIPGTHATTIPGFDDALSFLAATDIHAFDAPEEHNTGELDIEEYLNRDTLPPTIDDQNSPPKAGPPQTPPGQKPPQHNG